MPYKMTLPENSMAGLVQRRAELRTNIALKILRDGMPVNKIQEWAQLPIERVKEIANKNSIAPKVD